MNPEVLKYFTETFQWAAEGINWGCLAADIILVLFFSWFYIAYFFLAIPKEKKLPKSNPKAKFAVLVPARNESKVIRGLLKSLKAQDYDKNLFDVFVIVESSLDPTIDIVREFNYFTVIRGDITNRKTKGYALDDAYQYIKKNNLKYDAFMVFDADNLLNPDFLSKMNDAYCQGYQICVGYRGFVNASKNWIAASSATLFSYINTFTTRGRSILFNKATLSGTGYYVISEIVEDAGGWIWDGMTEDVELTYYSYKHNIKMKYYPAAKYYDEQSTTYKEVHKQHIRWTWGFFGSKKKFKTLKKEYSKLNPFLKFLGGWEYKISIYPFAVFCILETLVFLCFIALMFASIVLCPSNTLMLLGYAVYHFALVYIVFMLVAIITIAVDYRNLKFKPKTIISIIFTYFFYMCDFVLAFLDGLFHKEKRRTWKEIKHKGEIVDKQALDLAAESLEVEEKQYEA